MRSPIKVYIAGLTTFASLRIGNVVVIIN